MPMPSARPKFFWPAKIKFWLAKNNLAGQKYQNPIQKCFKYWFHIYLKILQPGMVLLSLMILESYS